jgi:hypothetical protein
MTKQPEPKHELVIEKWHKTGLDIFWTSQDAEAWIAQNAGKYGLLAVNGDYALLTVSSCYDRDEVKAFLEDMPKR